VGTQLAATMVTAFSADPTQRRIMLALPFVFTVFIINFQAGLIVYWITTNVWTIGQQLLVKKLYPKPERPDAAGASDSAKPARGKPPATVAAVSDGEGDGAAAGKPKRGEPAAEGNGGPVKAPPQSPRKKKKRSGRRR